MLNILKEHQLISFTSVNYKGIPHPPTPLARNLDPLLQAAEGKPWGGALVQKVSGKGGAQPRCMPQAISFCGRCRMEDFIRLFKFLKTCWRCFVSLSLFYWGRQIISFGVLNYCVWGVKTKAAARTYRIHVSGGWGVGNQENCLETSLVSVQGFTSTGKSWHRFF